MLRLGIFVTSAALLLVAVPSPQRGPRPPGVTAASYLGSLRATTALTGVAIASDGTIVVAGTSTSSTLGGVSARVLGPQTGFVAKLDATATHVLWLSQAGRDGGNSSSRRRTSRSWATGSTVTRLAADGSAVAWDHAAPRCWP